MIEELPRLTAQKRRKRISLQPSYMDERSDEKGVDDSTTVDENVHVKRQSGHKSLPIKGGFNSM